MTLDELFRSMLEPLISVIVDYAHEPESIKQVLKTAKEWQRREFFDRIIHIVSCCGAGRDDWKKPIIGTLSYLEADFSVVTTEDYDSSDDPELILDLLTEQFQKNTQILFPQEYKPTSKYIKNTDRFQALRIAKQIAFEMQSCESQNIKNNLSLEESTIYPQKLLRILILSTSIGSQQTMTQPQGEIQYDEREEWRKVMTESK